MAISAMQALGQTSSALTANATARASSSSSTSSTTGTANITSLDFMTLLVTELKNQDPTNTTDPNQYVDQLVQINSLQQLIQINEGVSSLGTSTSSSTSSSSTSSSSKG